MKRVARHLSRLTILIAVLTVGLCSSVMNFRFGYALAATELDGLVIGVLSVSLDVVKWFAPVYAALAVSRLAFVRALSAVLIWTVCVSYSLTAAIGFSALNREAVVASRSDDTARHQRALEDRERALEELRVIKENRRWAATAGCTNATVPISVAFCARVLELQSRLQTAETALSGSRQVVSDPQAVMLARVSGLAPERVGIGLAMLVAVVSELVSSLGFFAISLPPKRRRTNGQKTRKKRVASPRRRAPSRAKRSNVVRLAVMRSLVL